MSSFTEPLRGESGRRSTLDARQIPTVGVVQHFARSLSHRTESGERF